MALPNEAAPRSSFGGGYVDARKPRLRLAGGLVSLGKSIRGWSVYSACKTRYMIPGDAFDL